MAKYTLTVPEIKAHLINAANVADTETWPDWITAITDTGNDTWVVQTTDNGFYEVQDWNYIVVVSPGDLPIQLAPEVIETLYTPVIEE